MLIITGNKPARVVKFHHALTLGEVDSLEYIQHRSLTSTHTRWLLIT